MRRAAPRKISFSFEFDGVAAPIRAATGAKGGVERWRERETSPLARRKSCVGRRETVRSWVGASLSWRPIRPRSRCGSASGFIRAHRRFCGEDVHSGSGPCPGWVRPSGHRGHWCRAPCGRSRNESTRVVRGDRVFRRDISLRRRPSGPANASRASAFRFVVTARSRGRAVSTRTVRWRLPFAAKLECSCGGAWKTAFLPAGRTHWAVCAIGHCTRSSGTPKTCSRAHWDTLLRTSGAPARAACPSTI
jgi:hypothetical protein